MADTPHPCPVADRGLTLRGMCMGCSGNPKNGQRSLGRGDVLCREGDSARTVFLVVEGLLRESIVDREGRLGACRPLRAGDIVGFESLSTGDYRATVDALTPSRVCALPVAEVRERLATTPDQGLTLAAILADDVAALRERLVRQTTLPAEARVLALLTELIGDEPAGAWVRLPLTREQIGQFLGLTIETVSRTVHRLAQRSVIELQGRQMRFVRSEPR